METVTIRKLFLISETPLVELDKMTRTQFSNEIGYCMTQLKRIHATNINYYAM